MVVSTNKTSNHRFHYYYTHITILCQVIGYAIIYKLNAYVKLSQPNIP